MSQLTRPQLEAAIRGGGSVLLPGGRHVTSLEDLPSEGELAQGDEAREDNALASLDAQIEALQRQKEPLLRAKAERLQAQGGTGARPPRPEGQAPSQQQQQQQQQPPPAAPAARAGTPPPEEDEPSQAARREGFRFEAPDAGDEGRRAGRKR